MRTKTRTESPQSWLKNALSSWITGLVFGLIVAVVLVFVTVTNLSRIEDRGTDLGNVLLVKLREAAFKVTLDSELPRKAEMEIGAKKQSEADLVQGYVFIDIDPGGIRSAQHLVKTDIDIASTTAGASASEDACAALVSALGTKYRLPPARSDGQSGNVELNCSQHRSPNRYLLAEIVSELTQRKPRLIVLDFVLYDDPGIFSEQENKALRGALEQSKVPVFFVAPYLYQRSEGDIHWLTRDSVGLFLPHKRSAHVHALPHFPVPGEPVRAFPECYRVTPGPGEGGTKAISSLPHAVATTVRTGEVALGSVCPDFPQRTRGNAKIVTNERIIYTLPGSIEHVDGKSETDFALAAKYNRLYVRCLAENLWKSEALCSQEQTFHGKVVVLGVSNPTRKDILQTPLGQMPGALVTLNAIRSYVLYPNLEERSIALKLVEKTSVTLACSLVWLGYWLLYYRRVAMSKSRGIAAWCTTMISFTVCGVAVCMLAVWLSLQLHSPPKLDILLPILAIGLEVYGEGARWVINHTHEFVDGILRKVFK